MPDDITRHLATLSKTVLTENMATWEQVIDRIGESIEKGSTRYWTPQKLNFIRVLASTRESRLFRAGLSRVYLTISTSQKLGLERGEHFLRLIWDEKNTPVVEYCRFGKTSKQVYQLTTFDDPLYQMLPFLKRLWYEGKEMQPPAPDA